MSLVKRRAYFDSGSFVTTGNTGVFIRTDQIADYLSASGCHVFGTFPSTGTELNQFAFSNSTFPRGENQFSYFICSACTSGSSFGPSGNVGYIDVELPSIYENQAWLVTNDIVAIGDSITGGRCEYYGGQIKTLVKGDYNSGYFLCTAANSVYARSNTGFSVSVQALSQCGIRFLMNDSAQTKMKWTSKVEVLQNISDVDMNFNTLSEGYYTTGLNPATGSASLDYPSTSSQNLNSIIVDSNLETGNYISLDGGLDNG